MNRSEFNLTALIAGIVFIVLGSLFLLERLGILDVSADFVLPVLLIGLGVGVILGGRRRTLRSDSRMRTRRSEDTDTEPV